MILTLTLAVSGCLPMTLLSVADGIYKNYKLDVLETKIDELERQNSVKFKIKEEPKEKPREEPKEKPREYMLDARSIFKRAFEESK